MRTTRLLAHQAPYPSVSSLTASLSPDFTHTCHRGVFTFTGGNLVRLPSVSRDVCGKCASLSLVTLLLISAVRAQQAAPETAPPLFPGGGLVSYISIITTRGLLPQSSSIPATARPTFAHEGDFTFIW